MDPLLTVEDLNVFFDVEGQRLRAVEDVSFHVNRGEVLGLVGESGCGKSVTSMSLLRLIPNPPGRIDSGRAMFGGKDLLQLPLADLRRVRGNDIGVIFQEPMTALSPLQRIGNQMVEALQFHRDISKSDAWAIGVDWLRQVGIPDPEERMYAYPFQFSGGMRQRAMIATVLMMEPQLVIADEPTTALDVTIQAQIFELMVEMKSADMSVLLITHDMGVIWELCDRVIVMYASEIVEEAAVQDLFKQPLHPYTEGLMQAVPTLTTGGNRLETIPGQVPSPLDYPDACRFCDRCKYVFDRCRNEKPQLTELPDGRRARCFLAKDRYDADESESNE